MKSKKNILPKIKKKEIKKIIKSYDYEEFRNFIKNDLFVVGSLEQLEKICSNIKDIPVWKLSLYRSLLKDIENGEFFTVREINSRLFENVSKNNVTINNNNNTITIIDWSGDKLITENFKADGTNAEQDCIETVPYTDKSASDT